MAINGQIRSAIYVFWHNLTACRFRALWKFVVDSGFRVDVIRLIRAFGHFIDDDKRQVEQWIIRMDNIEPSHEVIYPELLDTLNPDEMAPLLVIVHEGKFLILNGNHRYYRLKKLGVKEVRCLCYLASDAVLPPP